MQSDGRRFYLGFIVKLLFFIGLLALAIPFIASTTGHHVPEQTRSPWHIEVDWSGIEPGTYQIVQWPLDQEVWIYRRQQYDLGLLPNLGHEELRDPLSQHSRQPAELNNAWRSRTPAVFVFLPYETSRGCRVHLDADNNQFVEACHGARFDTAGRILRHTGVAEQRNLTVPNYQLSGDNSLRLLPPGN